MDLVELTDIRAAVAVLDGVVTRTPVTATGWTDDGGELWLKLENRQPIGAFKLRGAYHAIANLPAPRRRRGVVTHSSGNHGQAVAYAAREFGVPATVVMPEQSVPLKIDRVRALGAEVVLVPAGQRLDAAQQLAAERGMNVIPPYDDRHVIAGQGTIGLEILDQLPDVATVVVPVGGGGLASGVATAVKALRPEVRVIGVEPELAADARDSLLARQVVPWPVAERGRTIADGVRAQVSELTVAHLVAHLDDIVMVSEAQIRDTVARLHTEIRVTAEPSGALATAGYLTHPESLSPGPTLAVVTGGNIDPALLRDLTS